MHVFLIRHAAAIDETLELRDPLRHLTAEGRTQASQLGERLRWHDCAPTHVWTSPLVRAVQTAELVVAGIGEPLLVESAAELAPEGATHPVIAALQALPPDACALLVGHEPGLSAIGAVLVGRDLPPLAKAEAIRIVDGKLRWRFAWNADAPIPA